MEFDCAPSYIRMHTYTHTKHWAGPVLAAHSLASGGALTAGQPIDGLNIDANSVSSVQLLIRTRFGNKGDSGG